MMFFQFTRWFSRIKMRSLISFTTAIKRFSIFPNMVFNCNYTNNNVKNIQPYISFIQAQLVTKIRVGNYHHFRMLTYWNISISFCRPESGFSRRIYFEVLLKFSIYFVTCYRNFHFYGWKCY